MGSDRKTLSFYDASAAEYAGQDMPASEYERLEHFMAKLPEGGKVMDLGCGGGWAAAYMAKAGFTVTAIDGSPGIAAEAARLAGFTVKVQRFDEIDEVGAYDGIWSNYALHHVPRGDLPAILTSLSIALRPSGVLFLTVKGGKGQGRDRLQRFYAYYTEDELSGLITSAGPLDIFWRDNWSGRGFDGTPSKMIAFMARKAADQ
jgi:cyclopropane fatty-acyl-phospholipid synthase-like methyltransferase